MTDNKDPIAILLASLKERAKELNCIYRVEEHLHSYEAPLEKVFNGIIKDIPPGWQYPQYCQARILVNNLEFKTEGYVKSEFTQTSSISVQGLQIGTLEVSYTDETPKEDEGPFLKEERKLIDTIADRISRYLTHRQLKTMLSDVQNARTIMEKNSGQEARTIIELLRKTDFDLYLRISRKILNYVHRTGIRETEPILQKLSLNKFAHMESAELGMNIPTKKKPMSDLFDFSREIFEIAFKYMEDSEIIENVQKWMQEDKISFLVTTLNEPVVTLDDIADKLNRYQTLVAKEHIQLSESSHRGIRIQLINRLMNPDLNFIKIAKSFIDIDDFVDIFSRMVYQSGSTGKFGGKGSGLVLAYKIVQKLADSHRELLNIKVPKTYYITTDGLHNFVRYNDMADLIEQKYKDTGQVRQEYPQIIEIFKNSRFPPEIIQKLSLALDDFGENPIIVRSSSLLEDQLGSAFSGKYESFFLANQGKKQERLEALLDAIAEVYASTFSPDAIEYRAERDLLDAHEEMGILLQEVVGTKVGPYFLPAFAGVAFSSNEFRWSPRIKRTDGLIRLVPGLGTRAVDRLVDEYPILIAPGQPNLRVNVTPEEAAKYSPRKLDVLNLETNTFETVDFTEFVKLYWNEFKPLPLIASILDEGMLKPVSVLDTDFETCHTIVTFDSLIKNTSFVKQVKSILDLLQKTLGFPVDIEFASDGKDFYLLQCRPQNFGKSTKPAPIPKDLPEDQIVFTAARFISNGYVPDITHIVYVDPQKYSEIEDKEELLNVGRAVGKLNEVLPKRQFILMGPGRWGSRGDIKLGVNVTYSDISNTAVLIEIARQKGNYVPDLSFGTHFFQDLVESDIRYIPLYPDTPGILFKEKFLANSKSILTDLLPEYKSLEEVVRVIDIPRLTSGKILRILMNADLDEAVGFFGFPTEGASKNTDDIRYEAPQDSKEHWRWRYYMVEIIAARAKPEQYGLQAFYLIGSVKNGSAGPASDIDLLLHFRGDEKQKTDLEKWLEGWGQALDELNYLRTGYRTGGLLDVHIITDDDIKNKTSWAQKINSVTDPAREMPMNRQIRKKTNISNSM